MGFVTRLFQGLFGGVKEGASGTGTAPITVSGVPSASAPTSGAATPPSVASASADVGSELTRRAQAATAGFGGTVATGAQGTSGTPMTANKTLLGT